MKIAHIADTHIKNLKYHQEYKEIFEQIYDSLRENKVDYIVHCGDIAHTKTQISPEFVDMATRFFANLAEVKPDKSNTSWAKEETFPGGIKFKLKFSGYTILNSSIKSSTSAEEKSSKSL